MIKYNSASEASSVMNAYFLAIEKKIALKSELSEKQINIQRQVSLGMILRAKQAPRSSEICSIGKQEEHPTTSKASDHQRNIQ